MLVADIHPFEATISVVGAIAFAIAGLAVFFKLLSRVGRANDVKRIAIEGVVNSDKQCTVQLGSGKVYEDIQIIGVTDSSPSKGGFPWELHGMLILKKPDGSHVLVQAKLVKSIEVPPCY